MWSNPLLIQIFSPLTFSPGLSFFAKSPPLISSPISLPTRFSPSSSSILFTLNRTSSTVHRSLLGAKTMSLLRVRIKFVLREDSHAVQCQQRWRILCLEVFRRLNLSSFELPGWATDANLVGHRCSRRDLLVSLWAPALGGEEGWACELSGRECMAKRERE